MSLEEVRLEARFVTSNLRVTSRNNFPMRRVELFQFLT
jgi:hypothetical protein